MAYYRLHSLHALSPFPSRRDRDEPVELSQKVSSMEAANSLKDLKAELL